MTHHALTPDTLPRLFSPQALLVHLRHLSTESLDALTVTMQRLNGTHPQHWQAIKQAMKDRRGLESQGSTSWRE